MTETTFAITRGGATASGASLTELVAHLIPGYLAMSDDDALLARYGCSAATTSELQELAAAQSVSEGTFDPSTASEAHLTAIMAPRAKTVEADALVPVPLDLPGLGLPLEWTHAVPLFLVATDYAPYVDRPKPSGNVFWVDPATERTFLGSLSSVGVISLYISGPDAAGSGL